MIPSQQLCSSPLCCASYHRGKFRILSRMQMLLPRLFSSCDFDSSLKFKWIALDTSCVLFPPLSHINWVVVNNHDSLVVRCALHTSCRKSPRWCVNWLSSRCRVLAASSLFHPSSSRRYPNNDPGKQGNTKNLFPSAHCASCIIVASIIFWWSKLECSRAANLTARWRRDHHQYSSLLFCSSLYSIILRIVGDLLSKHIICCAAAAIVQVAGWKPMRHAFGCSQKNIATMYSSSYIQYQDSVKTGFII